MRRTLASLLLIWQALRRSGVLHPHPARALYGLAVAILRDGLSIYTLLAFGARRNPHGVALKDDERSLDWHALRQETSALACGLQTLGIGRGTTVGLLCRNHLGFVEALLAASRLGADIVLLNTRFESAQLARALALHHVELLVLDAQFAETVAASGFDGRRVISDQPKSSDTPTLAEMRHTPLRRLRKQRVGGLVVLTSGTSGGAKGVRRKPTLAQLAGVTHSLLTVLSLRAGTPTLVTVPLFHGYGLAALALGLALGAPMAITRRTDGTALCQWASSFAAEVIVTVPTLLQRMLSAAKPPCWQNVRCIVSGSDILPATLAKQTLDQVGPVLFNLYGSTETGLLTIATPADLRLAPDSVGHAVHGAQLRICDQSGNPVACGEVGEVRVESPMLFDRYTGDTRRRQGRTYATGDRAYQDKDGRIFLQGRMDEPMPGLEKANGSNSIPLREAGGVPASARIQAD